MTMSGVRKILLCVDVSGDENDEYEGAGELRVDRHTRCTYDFLKTYRRLEWEVNNDWEEEDLDRVISSKEALKEDLQDFSIPIVMIGGDVVSLYPNLDVNRVAEEN